MDPYNKYNGDYSRLLHHSQFYPPNTPSTPSSNGTPTHGFGAGGLLNSGSSSSSINSNYYLHPSLRYPTQSQLHYQLGELSNSYNGIGPPLTPNISPNLSPHHHHYSPQLYHNYRYGYSSPAYPYSNSNYYNSREINAYYHHRHHHRNHYDSYGRIVGSSSSSSTDGLISHGYHNAYPYDPIAGMHQTVRNSGLGSSSLYPAPPGMPGREIEYSLTHHHPQMANNQHLYSDENRRYLPPQQIKDDDSVISQLTMETPETPTNAQLETQSEHLEHQQQQQCDQHCDLSLTLDLSSPTGSNNQLNELSLTTLTDDSNNHNKSAGSNLHSNNIDSLTIANDKSTPHTSNINDISTKTEKSTDFNITKSDNNSCANIDKNILKIIDDDKLFNDIKKETRENDKNSINTNNNNNNNNKINKKDKKTIDDNNENENENELYNNMDNKENELNLDVNKNIKNNEDSNDTINKKEVPQNSEPKEFKPRIKIVQSREKLLSTLKNNSIDLKVEEEKSITTEKPTLTKNERSLTPHNDQSSVNQLAIQQKNLLETQQKQQKSQQQQHRSDAPFNFQQQQQQQQRSSNPYLSQQHYNSSHQQSNNYCSYNLQSRYPSASPAYNPNCSPYYHNNYPYSNGSSGSNWSPSPYSSPNYSWSPLHQQQSPQHRYHFSPPLTKLPARKRSFSPISSSHSNASFKSASNKAYSIESDCMSNKKIKRKTQNQKSEPVAINNKTNEIKSEIKTLDIKPLPGFQQAFGSTEIGRFSEVFLNAPSSNNDNYNEYESEADTNASPYPWETGDSLEGPHYNLHVGASVQSIYSNSSDNYGSSSIDSPLDNNYFREIRCDDN